MVVTVRGKTGSQSGNRVLKSQITPNPLSITKLVDSVPGI